MMSSSRATTFPSMASASSIQLPKDFWRIRHETGWFLNRRPLEASMPYVRAILALVCPDSLDGRMREYTLDHG